MSWRVLILPFLDQQALYDQFHLDEPWDSPHNRTLIAKMPAVFRCPAENEALAADGKTRTSRRAAPARSCRAPSPSRMRDITDGTSNTIMAIDAGDEHAVVWTKPADWEFDPEPGDREHLQESRARRHQHGVCRRLGALHPRHDRGRDPARLADACWG